MGNKNKKGSEKNEEDRSRCRESERRRAERRGGWAL